MNGFPLKGLSNAPFRGAVPLLVPELLADLSKNVKKIYLWWPLVTRPLSDLKTDQSSFVIIPDTFRMQLAACRYVAQEPSWQEEHDAGKMN